MLERIGRIALPPWIRIAVIVSLTVFAALFLAILLAPPKRLPNIHVAFIGNSMQYYNDLPRFMEALSSGRVTQNSCLHGGASLRSIPITGNGMYDIWTSGSARIYTNDTTNENEEGQEARIYDYGACTVPQLLFGYDEALDERVQNGGVNEDDEYGDDFFSYSDGTNPCYKDEYYYQYLQDTSIISPPKYDYIVLNDNTRSSARLETRTASLEVLESTYVDWFLETGAIPVFICTYAYHSPYRDMGGNDADGGLSSVPEFTSYTVEGYRLYAETVAAALPAWQQPRIAPVAIAFLVVWEENYALWQRLFHVDFVHPSLLGTYLQGCVLHYTLMNAMPVSQVAVRSDMSELWNRARRLQPAEHRRMPFPTQDDAAYLYNVAVRVVKRGYVPPSFIHYYNGEGVDYEPQDDLFRSDDLY